MNLLSHIAQLLGVRSAVAAAPGMPARLKPGPAIDPVIQQYRDAYKGQARPYPAFSATSNGVPYNYPAYSGSGWQPAPMAQRQPQLKAQPLPYATLLNPRR